MKSTLTILTLIAMCLGCDRCPCSNESSSTPQIKESAMTEHKNAVTMKGSPLTLLGDLPKIGQPAPDATLLANDLSEVKISSFKGKTCILSIVPSLDTKVCDLQTRHFNEEAAALGDNVKILTISMDLPFAQARWCGAAGVDRLQTLSDHRDAAFAIAYGLLIKELRLLARCVLVIDKNGNIAYIQLVPELTHEPDYPAALQAVKKFI